MSKIYDYVINNEVNKNVLKSIVAAEGGEESWETIFEGEVTTTNNGGPLNGGNFGDNLLIQDDTIKVTFNGKEYVCNKNVISQGSIYGGVTPDGPDFSEYPFTIMSGNDGIANRCLLYTESAGTYSIKIEAPNQSSGGSTEFSMAKVTVHIPAFGQYTLTLPIIESGMLLSRKLNIADIEQNHKCVVPLYNGSFILENVQGVDSVEGSITIDGPGSIIITGAGSINMLKN
jgi:hypothetical protein